MPHHSGRAVMAAPASAGAARRLAENWGFRAASGTFRSRHRGQIDGIRPTVQELPLNDAERAAMREELGELCERVHPNWGPGPDDPAEIDAYHASIDRYNLNADRSLARCIVRTIHYFRQGVPVDDVCAANFHRTEICYRIALARHLEEYPDDAVDVADDPPDDPDVREPDRLTVLPRRPLISPFGLPGLGGGVSPN
jgi:hypothetical protein